jgi:hypothetical protein
MSKSLPSRTSARNAVEELRIIAGLAVYSSIASSPKSQVKTVGLLVNPQWGL